MVRSGKSGSSPLKQGYVERLAQNHILVASEYLQGGRAHNFSGSLGQLLAHGAECYNRGMKWEKKSFNYLQKTPQLYGSSSNCLLETQEKMSLFKIMIFVTLTCNFWQCRDSTKLNLMSPVAAKPLLVIDGEVFYSVSNFSTCANVFCAFWRFLYYLTGNILRANLLNLTVIWPIGKLQQLH